MLSECTVIGVLLMHLCAIWSWRYSSHANTVLTGGNFHWIFGNTGSPGRFCFDISAAALSWPADITMQVITIMAFMLRQSEGVHNMWRAAQAVGVCMD